MTTTQTIGQGTKLLAELACGLFWPCEECKETRRCYCFVSGMFTPGDFVICPTCGAIGESESRRCSCTQDPWLRAALADQHDSMWWQVFADHLEEHHPTRLIDQWPASEVARMVSRLLPLDVFPRESPLIPNEPWISGWYSMGHGHASILKIELPEDLLNLLVFQSYETVAHALMQLNTALIQRAETGVQT